MNKNETLRDEREIRMIGEPDEVLAQYKPFAK